MTADELGDALERYLGKRPLAPPHVHPCPKCYEPWPCGASDCTIEPDLERDNGMPSGAYCVCPPCRKKESKTA